MFREKKYSGKTYEMNPLHTGRRWSTRLCAMIPRIVRAFVRKCGAPFLQKGKPPEEHARRVTGRPHKVTVNATYQQFDSSLRVVVRFAQQIERLLGVISTRVHH